MCISEHAEIRTHDPHHLEAAVDDEISFSLQYCIVLLRILAFTRWEEGEAFVIEVFFFPLIVRSLLFLNFIDLFYFFDLL